MSPCGGIIAAREGCGTSRLELDADCGLGLDADYPHIVLENEARPFIGGREFDYPLGTGRLRNAVDFHALLLLGSLLYHRIGCRHTPEYEASIV